MSAERLVALAPRFSRMPFVFLTALADRDSELKGRRLKGRWTLIRMGNAQTRKKDLWLLMKLDERR